MTTVARVNGDHSGPRTVGARKQFEVKLTFADDNYTAGAGGTALSSAVRDDIAALFGVTYIGTVIPMHIMAATGSAVYGFEWVADGQKYKLNNLASAAEHSSGSLDGYKMILRCESYDMGA
jgi:hypothetical protein